MSKRIQRALVGVAATVVATATAFFVGAPSASAFGGETFGCQVAPGPVTGYTASCRNISPAGSYNVGFALQNLSGTGYTTSWSLSGPYTSVFSGCGTNDTGCNVVVPNGDGIVSATITFSQGGQTGSLTARAVFSRFCGNQRC